MNEMAEAFAEAVQKQNEQLKQYYIPTATGESLNTMGTLFGISRKSYLFGLIKESDAKYKKRLRTSIENNFEKAKKKHFRIILNKVKDLMS